MCYGDWRLPTIRESYSLIGFFGMTNRDGGAPMASSPEAPVTAIAGDEYRSNVVERHRRLAAATLPFDDQALIYASYEGGM